MKNNVVFFNKSLTPISDEVRDKIQHFVSRFGMTSEDVKNLTISALMMKLIAKANKEDKGILNGILKTVKELGFGNVPVEKLNLQVK